MKKIKKLGLMLTGIMAGALMISNNYAAISCTNASVKFKGQEATVSLNGIEGETLNIAKKLNLPDADKPYYYTNLEMGFSTKNCIVSNEDASIITCENDKPKLYFTFPATTILGSVNIFKIVRHTTLEADGRKEVKYEWSILFVDLKNKMVYDDYVGINCTADITPNFRN